MIIYLLLGINGISLLTTLYIGSRIIIAYHNFTMKKLLSPPSLLNELPTVSVCIPARNEQHAMLVCIERVLASRYPKLEILVLDDNSSDKTSFIIKSFAHDGVRFIAGGELPDGWLGKNYSLSELLNEASGQYVLFMDVDTNIEPDTIGQLVSYIEQEKTQMLSVLPVRKDSYRANVIFGTLRYLWDIFLYRKNRPITASNAWMANRDEMIKTGGFNNFKMITQPETEFAKLFHAKNSYRFIISNNLLGLGYEKRWKSQILTSVRLIFPLLGFNIFKTILAMLVIVTLFAPSASLLFGLYASDLLLVTLSCINIILIASIYGYYLHRIRQNGWILGVFALPYQLIQEIALIVISVFSYNFKRVSWKGRRIRK